MTATITRPDLAASIRAHLPARPPTPAVIREMARWSKMSLKHVGPCDCAICKKPLVIEWPFGSTDPQDDYPCLTYDTYQTAGNAPVTKLGHRTVCYLCATSPTESAARLKRRRRVSKGLQGNFISGIES